MNKILFLFLSLILISCKSDINCSGNDEKQVYFDLLSEDFEKIYNDLKEKNELDVVFDLPFEDVKKDFFEDVVKLEGMRPSKIEKELKKCECEAELTAELPEDVTKYLLDNLSNYYSFDEKELKEPYKFNKVKYNLQLTEDGKIYCETYKKDKLNQAFMDYSYFINIINNHKNGMFNENVANESFDNGSDWLNHIFTCANNENEFCFPIENDVCSKRFLEYMSEKGSIYGPSNYTNEERKIAETKYKAKWKNTYKILEDDMWLFGRGNGDVEGYPLKSVKIKEINDLEFEVEIDYDGAIKTKNFIKLVKNEDSYLIDFCESIFY